jgi:hypothetical protein
MRDRSPYRPSLSEEEAAHTALKKQYSVLTTSTLTTVGCVSATERAGVVAEEMISITLSVGWVA